MIASRFVSLSHLPTGEMLIYNSKSGMLGKVAPEQVAEARTFLMPGNCTQVSQNDSALKSQLIAGGFLVPKESDENAAADELYLKKYEDHRLHLIIMPTEQCNFRCVYCYESFLKKSMPASIQDGIARFVEAREDLRVLDVNWFGGEPLLAMDVLRELSARFKQSCQDRGVSYMGSMTTNGYLLDRSTMSELVRLGISRFQITIDGSQADHDCRRVLESGEPTFTRIIDNLRDLKRSDLEFEIMLRHNFDAENLQRVEPFISFLAEEFGGDQRFTTFFHAIGRWGGPNDSEMDICEGRDKGRALILAQQTAAESGFADGTLQDHFKPNGFTCYAGNPNSFVVAPNGELYKCTVELDTMDRNIVGSIGSDGRLNLDWAKMALWTETNGNNSKGVGPGAGKCTTCHFSPACHGAYCPKEWMDSKGATCECPPHKSNIKAALPLLQIQSRLTGRPTRGEEV